MVHDPIITSTLAKPPQTPRRSVDGRLSLPSPHQPHQPHLPPRLAHYSPLQPRHTLSTSHPASQLRVASASQLTRLERRPKTSSGPSQHSCAISDAPVTTTYLALSIVLSKSVRLLAPEDLPGVMPLLSSVVPGDDLFAISVH
ncbi:hypothetical protein E2P81_ATG09010 [Venturia nashicola]|uniref:Uncharacterized protein n=1 Tax=Venturia nashicola TaxID=86259 RepID=A0A4Z1NNF3_9PEZI|nr:hypothetical protein E6O75_ATG09211 [Venturia nashicola]TLD23666.1 hypothetical protein E2P81_ATG09010 [Venturia nashicola]